MGKHNDVPLRRVYPTVAFGYWCVDWPRVAVLAIRRNEMVSPALIECVRNEMQNDPNAG